MIIKKILAMFILLAAGNAYSSDRGIPNFNIDKWVKVISFTQEPSGRMDTWITPPSSLEIYVSSDGRESSVWAIQTNDYGNQFLPEKTADKIAIQINRASYLRMLDLASRMQETWPRFVSEGKSDCYSPRKHILFGGKSQTIIGSCGGDAENLPSISDNMKVLSGKLEKLLKETINEGTLMQN